MYSKIQLAFKYLHYYFTSSNSKGHGMHSPFVFAFITEVLNDDRAFYAYANIENSVLDELVVCDTIPLKRQSPKIKVLSVAELFAVAIRNAHENRSITGLFIHSQLRNK